VICAAASRLNSSLKLPDPIMASLPQNQGRTHPQIQDPFILCSFQWHEKPFPSLRSDNFSDRETG
jgi:hypothetical protein